MDQVLRGKVFNAQPAAVRLGGNNMRSAARLRPGSAEGEPLPSSLVLLLRSSSISSVDDLKMLLQQEGGATEDDDEDEDEAAGGPLLVNQTHSRSTRSVAAVQPAQQAVCKLRTEVMEVTRSMLDRRNANFLLWPPCVEVQRCSGCCNTRARQCVAAAAATRRLTVIKIQYSNKRPHYAHATITVEDHVSCRCQLSSSSSSSSIIIQRNPVPPPPSSPRAPPSAHASKADLHRHDDLKHNQQHGGGGGDR
ncbi:platelet-derived growth factor subunit B [Pseudoliparis swirei]|uniref:platelet-derived growth factor subunit B n=1 Tax=Pseudoliparis swirei TaxID=2059687 RepID=UPI0024BDB63F|nr:platelet-derived growth factor subunit B [Pseudoliparis swirei]